MSTIRVVCLSDTHGKHRKVDVPDGDLLIHSGDFCTGGKESEARNFSAWLHELPHREKVIVAGNHDLCMERDMTLGRRLFQRPNEHYLFDREVTLFGLRIYGSPWQPAFFDWAFNLPRNGPQLREVWSRIPEGIDILVTHGPPHRVHDRTVEGDYAGDEVLREQLESMVVPPRLHVFGHIHEGYGYDIWNDRMDRATVAANASICTRNYAPRNKPLVFDVPVDGPCLDVRIAIPPNVTERFGGQPVIDPTSVKV